MRNFNLLLISIAIPLFFSSCSTTIVSLEEFEESDLNSTKLSPNSFEIKSLKYRVFTTSDELSKVLLTIENISLVDEINISEYSVSLNMENKRFNNQTISVGRVNVKEMETNRTIRKIPIFNIELNSSQIVNELKSIFSIKRGFVVEKRVNRDDEPIFKINMGKNSGIKEGIKLNIYDYQESKSYLSGESRRVLHKIGIGVVSQFIKDSYAWIYLQNNNLANRIFFGSVVTIKKENFDTYLEDGKLFMKSNDEVLDNKIRIH